MVEKQKNKLEEFVSLGIDILWKGLEEVEENNINGIVIANEVLDALPVERITFSKGKLLRQAVSIDKKSHKLRFQYKHEMLNRNFQENLGHYSSFFDFYKKLSSHLNFYMNRIF